METYKEIIEAAVSSHDKASKLGSPTHGDLQRIINEAHHKMKHLDFCCRDCKHHSMDGSGHVCAIKMINDISGICYGRTDCEGWEQ